MCQAPQKKKSASFTSCSLHTRSLGSEKNISTLQNNANILSALSVNFFAA